MLDGLNELEINGRRSKLAEMLPVFRNLHASGMSRVHLLVASDEDQSCSRPFGIVKEHLLVSAPAEKIVQGHLHALVNSSIDKITGDSGWIRVKQMVRSILIEKANGYVRATKTMAGPGRC